MQQGAIARHITKQSNKVWQQGVVAKGIARCDNKVI